MKKINYKRQIMLLKKERTRVKIMIRFLEGMLKKLEQFV